jgi:aspartyl-tRNA(Asn)/glutamyl-tRNA(Gln) amidotransferase subunit C
MALSLDDLKHLEKLANLEVGEKRLIEIEPQLNEILDFVGELQKVDVSGVEETVETTGLNNIYESDQIREHLSQEDAISSALNASNGYVLVPAIFEEDSDA